MTLAREGYAPVAAALVAALAASFFGATAAVVFWAAFVLVVQFFREPRRDIVAGEKDIVSPADGRVVFVGPAMSPLDRSSCLKISVFMNLFNAHVNRAPVGGQVSHSRRHGGGFFNAALDKASEQNERHLVAIDSAHGVVVCVQIAGLLARRVLCYAAAGDLLTVGQRYGFIRFGSRVDLYLPRQLRPQVALGDKVAAGVTVMAENG